MKFWKWFFVLVGPALLGGFIGVMLMVAYPKSLEVGGRLCPDEKPDVFVVRYTVSTSDGQGTNFTVFCMSERGEIEEIGTWGPLLVLCIYTTVPFYLFILFGTVRGLLRRISGGGGSDPPGDPFAPAMAGDPPPDPFAGLVPHPPETTPPDG